MPVDVRRIPLPFLLTRWSFPMTRPLAAPLTVPPKTGHKTLLYSELALDLDHLEADIAVLGMPYGAAYSAADFTNDQTRAPAAIRAATDRVVRSPGHYDFDIDGPLLQERD